MSKTEPRSVRSIGIQPPQPTGANSKLAGEMVGRKYRDTCFAGNVTWHLLGDMNMQQCRPTNTEICRW